MKKIDLLLVVIIFFFGCNQHNLNPQKKGDSHFIKRADSIDIAILSGNQELFNKIESKLLSSSHSRSSNTEILEDKILLCSIQINKGEKQNLDSAIQISNSIIKDVESTFGNNSDEFTTLKLLTGWAHGYSGDLDKEMSIINELLQLELTQAIPDNHRLAEYYNTIGMNYNYRGENLNELLNLKKALNCLQAIPDIKNDMKAYQSLINVYSAISLSYLMAQDHVNATYYSNKCIDERNKSGIFTPQIAINYMILGRAKFALTGNIDTGMFFMNKAINILESNGMTNSPPWVSYQGHIAELKVKSGDVTGGIENFNKMIEIFKSSDNPELINVIASDYYREVKALIESNQVVTASQKSSEANAYANLHQDVIRPFLLSLIRNTEAQSLSQNKQWNKAETIFEKEMNKNGGSIARLISQQGIPFHTPQNVIPIYLSYANMYLSRSKESVDSNEKMEYLQSAISSYKRIIHYYNNRESFYSNQNLNQSVTIDKNEQVDVFENCLLALNSQLQLAEGKKDVIKKDSIMSDIYAVIEASKVNVLQKVLHEEELFNSLLPTEVNMERKQKAKELDKLGLALRQNFEVQKEIELQAKFDDYKKWLESSAAKYHIPILEESASNSFSDYIKTEPTSLVCNYFLGRENMFCFSKLNNQTKFSQQLIPEKFNQQLEYINKEFLSGDKINNLNKDSIEIAKSIFKDWHKILLDYRLLQLKPSDIVIIPSRQLHKIPFDLLTDSVGSYLIENYPIRYELSGSLFCKVPVKKDGKGFAGFAASDFNYMKKEMDQSPSIAMRGGNYDLPQTNKEVETLATLTKGDAYKNTTPSIFKSNAGNYSFIHIATHAFSSDNISDDNYLAFEQDKGASNFKVYSSDVQRLGLNANFCMLASCESGTGYIDEKEGAMSIGKSFIEAGVPSVGISFWKLSDNENTVKLISSFYSNMLKGMTKAKALQQAKVEYLKTHPGIAERLPFYWAGLAIIGNDNTIKLEENSGNLNTNIIYLVGAILVAVFGYFIFRRRKSA